MKKNFVIFSMFFLLAACTLAPKDTGKSYMFALEPATVTHRASGGKILTVALPSAADALDTYRIALVRDGGRRDYYAGARWAEFLPVMVQDSITKTLKAVMTDLSGITGEQVLKIEIRTFQAEYENGNKTPVIKIRLRAIMRKRLDQSLLDSFEIKAERKASRDSLPEIQKAFAGAFDSAQKQLVYKLTGGR